MGEFLSTVAMDVDDPAASADISSRTRSRPTASVSGTPQRQEDSTMSVTLKFGDRVRVTIRSRATGGMWQTGRRAYPTARNPTTSW